MEEEDLFDLELIDSDKEKNDIFQEKLQKEENQQTSRFAQKLKNLKYEKKNIKNEENENQKKLKKKAKLNQNMDFESEDNLIRDLLEEEEDENENIEITNKLLFGNNPEIQEKEKEKEKQRLKQEKLQNQNQNKNQQMDKIVKSEDNKGYEIDLNMKKMHIKDGDRWKQFEDYHCMLNLTDISYGVKGHNKFYEVKIEFKGKEFRVAFRWGRVGAKAQERQVGFESKYEAIIEFKNKFYEKTHNNWEDRVNFKTRDGKYTLIKVEGSNRNKMSVNEEINSLNKRNNLIRQRIKSNKSILNEKLKDLMVLVWDIERINKVLSQLNFDTEKNPLGKLQYIQIQKGYKILSEIAKNLKKPRVSKSLIIELTNQFYTNIPQSYGMQRPPEIDNFQRVQEKVHLLDILKEIDITNKFIKKIVSKQENLNPLDCFYDMLEINLINLSQNSSNYRIISNTITESHGPTHKKYKLIVKDIFEVQRRGESQRYHPFKALNNKKLLWHGSRITNYVGILSEGLRIAPPDAPVSGYMFGKGIYFSDVPSKAANYCYADIGNSEGVILLCEVALGNVKQLNQAQKFVKPPIYYHSVQGVGKNILDPERQDIELEEGSEVVLNQGKVVNNETLSEEDRLTGDLIYNEYIVYDVSQVQIKYLIRVKFDFV